MAVGKEIEEEEEEEEKESTGLADGSLPYFFIYYLLIGLTGLPCELKTNSRIKIPATSAPCQRKIGLDWSRGGNLSGMDS